MNQILTRAAIVALLSFVSLPAFAQQADVAEVWTGRRAETLPQGRFEVGVFSPLRYGLTERLELSTHPLAFFVVPNLSAKIAWNDERPWRFSTRHGVHYPSLLLRTLSREGTGGLLPSTTDVPHIFAFTNELLATTQIPLFRRWITVRLGFTVAPDIGDETVPPIELPIVFPRTAAYGNFGTGHAGIALEGQIVSAFYFFVDATMFVIPGYEGSFAFENTLMLSWRPSQRFMLAAGGRTIYGGYPYGARFHGVPMIDAKFGF